MIADCPWPFSLWGDNGRRRPCIERLWRGRITGRGRNAVSEINLVIRNRHPIDDPRVGLAVKLRADYIGSIIRMFFAKVSTHSTAASGS